MSKLTFLIFTFFSLAASAQQSNKEIFDSLNKSLSVSKEDTNRVLILYNLAKLYQDASIVEGFKNNPDTGLMYALKALSLSQKLNYKLGEFFSKMYLGRICWRKGNFGLALKYHMEALKYVEETGNLNSIALVSTYLGQDYADNGMYEEAIKYIINAKKAYSDINDTAGIANSCLLLSWVYASKGDFPSASKQNLEALRFYESKKDDWGISISSSNAAEDFYKLGKYENAIYYIKTAQKIQIKYNDIVNLCGNYIILSDIFIKMNNYKEAMFNARQALKFSFNNNDPISLGSSYNKIAQIYFELNKFDSSVYHYQLAINEFISVNANQNLALVYGNLALSYLRLNQIKMAKIVLDSAGYYSHLNDALPGLKIYFNGKQLYDSISGNWKDAYFNFYKYISIRDTIENTANTKKMMQNQLQYDFDKKEAEVKAEQEKKDIHQRTIRNSISAVLGGSIFFLIVVFRQRNKISKARKRSDELLLNILPEEVAEELKEKGSAEAKQFDKVTVMFTDFKNFTKISENLTPTELVNEIHTCFKEFDNIINKYNIEKIKTIGDSYMCVGGLPLPNLNNATDVVNAALDIQKYMLQHMEERKISGKEIFEIRIGIHSGPVVAGIVGVKKFAYDIWGDTVNIAARMEQNSEAGKINISSSTYDLIKDKFKCVYRGKINAKNKGEIDMYFLDV